MIKHYLVIGGTRGGGKQLVNMLLTDENCRVSVFGRNPEFKSGRDNLQEYAVDVTNYEQVCATIKAAVANFGDIFATVFMQRNRSKTDKFDKDIQVAVTATKIIIDFLTSEELLHKPDSSIVMISSIADNYIAEEQPAGYHVAKAGLVQLARYYALKLGKYGIRVNSISPCVVLKAEASEFYKSNKSLVDRYKKFIPLGRMGSPDDIANAIIFLTSPKASYITGQNLVVDGGLTLRSHESLIRDII